MIPQRSKHSKYPLGGKHLWSSVGIVSIQVTKCALPFALGKKNAIFNEHKQPFLMLRRYGAPMN